MPTKTLKQQVEELEAKVEILRLERQIQDNLIETYEKLKPKRHMQNWTQRESDSLKHAFFVFLSARAAYHQRTIGAIMAHIDNHDWISEWQGFENSELEVSMERVKAELQNHEDDRW